MSKVRVLVGTRKGAFILTSDGKRETWDIKGPLFGGWEIFHITGSPVDPDRIYASQSCSWFGQVIQRSKDGGETGSNRGLLPENHLPQQRECPMGKATCLSMMSPQAREQR